MGKEVSLIFIFMFLFSLSFTSAVTLPAQENINVEIGLQIFYPAYEVIPQGEPFFLHIHVTNKSNGIEVAGQLDYCYLHLYNSTGHHILQENMTLDVNNVDWEIYILGGNFSDLGEHSYRIYCQDTYGGEVGGTFMVTPTGTQFDVPTFNVYALIIVFLSLLMLYVSIMYSKLPEHSKNEDGYVISVSHLAFLRPVAIGFIWILLQSITYIVATVGINYLVYGSLGAFIFGIWQIMMYGNIIILPIWLIWVLNNIYKTSKLEEFLERGGGVNF